MPTCKMLPHGSYSLIPAIISTMAWIASLFQDGCAFARLTGPSVAEMAQNANHNQQVPPWLDIGFSAFREPVLDQRTGEWRVPNMEGACVDFPETMNLQDTMWGVSMLFDFIALVLGGGGSLFLWFTTCCVFSRVTWRLAGYEVLGAAVAQGLSFLWFATTVCQLPDNACALSWGSQADIIAAVFWFVAATSVFVYYPVPKDHRTGDGVWTSSPSNNGASSTRIRSSNRQLCPDSSRSVSSSGSNHNRRPNSSRSVSSSEGSRSNTPTSMASGEDSAQEGNSSRQSQGSIQRNDELKEVELL